MQDGPCVHCTVHFHSCYTSGVLLIPIFLSKSRPTVLSILSFFVMKMINIFIGTDQYQKVTLDKHLTKCTVAYTNIKQLYTHKLVTQVFYQ
jgi:hypothetical protein